MKEGWPHARIVDVRKIKDKWAGRKKINVDTHFVNYRLKKNENKIKTSLQNRIDKKY